VAAAGLTVRDVFFTAALGAALIGVAWLSLTAVERFEAGFVFCEMKRGSRWRDKKEEQRDVLP